MKTQKLNFIFSLLFILFINSNLYSQEIQLDIVGVWNSEDFSKNESKTIFSKDGYVSMTINGEEIDGKNFIIHGGPNNGQKGELKYEVNYKENPIQIDLIALKDNQEKGRILGILIPINQSKFIIAMSFDGKRPEKIDDENLHQTLTLIKAE